MKKRLKRILACVIAGSMCLGMLNLPALALTPEEQETTVQEEVYNLTVYIEEIPSEDSGSDELNAVVETGTSTETFTDTDPETGATTSTTVTETEWAGIDEDGMDVAGSGTNTETVTTESETTEGPGPGQTTTTTTTETTWSETTTETGSGEFDVPDAGTAIETTTETAVDGSETETEATTVDDQGRVVEEAGSAAGSETTTTVITEESTHTETGEPETVVTEGPSTVTGEETETHVVEGSQHTEPEVQEELPIDDSVYEGTDITLHPGETVTEEIPVDTSYYMPDVQEGSVEQVDENGTVTAIVETKKLTDEQGNTIGYTETTSYPGQPGRTTVTTVNYTWDSNGGWTGYNTETVDSVLSEVITTEESQETAESQTGPVEDADQPEPEPPQEVTFVLLPERPAAGATTDASGATTTVAVEELYDADGMVVGYQVKTTVTDAEGHTVSSASESVWGTKTIVTTRNVTHYTDTATTTETVTTTRVERYNQAVTQTGVTVQATSGELSARMGQVNGSLVTDYSQLATLLPYLQNDHSGIVDRETDLYNRPDSSPGGGSYTYDPNKSYFQWLGEYGIESAIRIQAPGSSGSTAYTWQPHQFVLTGKDDQKYYVYCTDFEVSPKPEADYDVVRMEDAGYYDGDAEEHIRAIALNGYWGTEEDTGSMDAFRQTLREAKNPDGTPRFTDEQIAAITPGMAVTATQAAIWYYGNSGSQLLDHTDIVGQYYNGGKDYTDVEPQTEALINSIYQYLITLEQEATTDNTLIDKDDFAKEVRLNVNKKNEAPDGAGSDTYDVDLTFTMALNVVPDRLSDDLVVQVVQLDENGNVLEVLGLGKLNGSDTGLRYDGNNTYTFAGLTLGSGAKLDLRLDGTQNLQEGVYLFRATGGYEISQTFVGVGNVKQDVHLNVELEFNITEPTATQISSAAAWDQVVEDTTTAEHERYTTVTVKSAEVVVTEQTTEELKRAWESESHRSYTYSEEEHPAPTPTPTPVPTPVIPEEDIPLTDIPGRERMLTSISEEDPPLTDIPDEEVPLAAIPRTGDGSGMWYALALLSGCGLAVVALPKKRKGQRE